MEISRISPVVPKDAAALGARPPLPPGDQEAPGNQQPEEAFGADAAELAPGGPGADARYQETIDGSAAAGSDLEVLASMEAFVEAAAPPVRYAAGLAPTPTERLEAIPMAPGDPDDETEASASWKETMRGLAAEYLDAVGRDPLDPRVDEVWATIQATRDEARADGVTVSSANFGAGLPPGAMRAQARDELVALFREASASPERRQELAGYIVGLTEAVEAHYSAAYDDAVSRVEGDGQDGRAKADVAFADQQLQSNAAARREVEAGLAADAAAEAAAAEDFDPNALPAPGAGRKPYDRGGDGDFRVTVRKAMDGGGPLAERARRGGDVAASSIESKAFPNRAEVGGRTLYFSDGGLAQLQAFQTAVVQSRPGDVGEPLITLDVQERSKMSMLDRWRTSTNRQTLGQ